MADSNLVSIRLPQDLRAEVDEFARSSKRSRSFIVKEAVESYMHDRRQYIAAIDEALVEADRGIFVSGEAVVKWLESWGTDNELASPEPDIFPDNEQ